MGGASLYAMHKQNLVYDSVLRMRDVTDVTDDVTHYSILCINSLPQDVVSGRVFALGVDVEVSDDELDGGGRRGQLTLDPRDLVCARTEEN